MYLPGIKKYIALITIACLPHVVTAQQAITLHGIFFLKSTAARIAEATVTDLNNRVVMMSDELGEFSIQTAKGDTLLFNRAGYAQQKQVVNGAGDIAVYMQPIVELPAVTVKEKSSRQELNDVVNTYRAKGLYFDGKPPIWLFSPFGGSPITGFYELFSRDARNERHFIKFSKTEMEAIEVSRRYNKELVKRVTGLPDEDVKKFMEQYSPSYEDVRQWNDYELIAHIKRYLAYYKTHKDGIKSDRLY